jgi:hypothetical protein
LLCRHHGCELETPLYPPYRFLSDDYGVFDCRGMAFRRANPKLIRVCSSLRSNLTSSSPHINGALNFAAQLPLAKHALQFPPHGNPPDQVVFPPRFVHLRERWQSSQPIPDALSARHSEIESSTSPSFRR